MPKPVVQVGGDPDPSEWLFISEEMKRADQSKPYDAKKACWVPDEAEGYLLGEIKATKGELVTVALPGGEVMYYFAMTCGRIRKPGQLKNVIQRRNIGQNSAIFMKKSFNPLM